MPESRWFNTGAGAYDERRSVPRNVNHRRYGDATDEPAAARVFATARRHIDAADTADTVDLAATGRLRESVARLEAEVARGDAADGTVIARCLRTISHLVPDLTATIAAGLIAPGSGAAMVVREAAGQAVRSHPRDDDRPSQSVK